ncbi:MAG: histidinol dehydrogenase [Opitutaceae bacterium]|nr:histidinol dehydrogenase [Opitutaceae bacterium]
MRLLRSSEPNFRSDLARFCASAAVPAEIRDAVAAILAAVRERGDAAIAEYVRKFDKAELSPAQFRVSVEELAAGAKSLTREQRTAIRAARRNIVDFNRRGLPRDWTARNPDGAQVGERFYPIRRVGLYVPGGQVPLVSTVLMTVLLAQIAKCPEVAVFTPSGPDGTVSPAMLGALHLIGVTEVYRIGGVQAVAAMAYGTETIPAVDKVFGPGNAYTVEAQRQVFGTVGVALLPGPSEVCVIADGSSNSEYVAADLLAQAEHGTGREKVYFVTTSEKVLKAVEAEIERQLPEASRAELIRRVLATGAIALLVKSLDEAASLANFIAPEHLELEVAAKAVPGLLKKITTAGAVLVGGETPTALGDFVAGPSHTLPTGRTGRFFSGLRVADFLRRTSVVRYDARSLPKAAPVVAAFSAMEKLDAHGRSCTRRLEKH